MVNTFRKTSRSNFAGNSQIRVAAGRSVTVVPDGVVGRGPIDRGASLFVTASASRSSPGGSLTGLCV